MTVDRQLLTATDFIGVRAALVRELGGDGNRALVLTRIYFRADQRWREAHDADGAWWWRASYGTIAAETGLSIDQARRCVTWLVAHGYLLAAKHHIEGPYDQTQSLRVYLLESPDDAADSPDVDAADSPDVPSMQTEKTVSVKDGRRTDAEIDHVFGLFWKIYPKHTARAEARKKFTAALKKERASIILDGARSYAALVKTDQRDPRFVLHPTTWLNQERWSDDHGPVAGTGRDSIRSL